MALHSRICEIFGIQYPIVLAGMGGGKCSALGCRSLQRRRPRHIGRRRLLAARAP